MTTSIPEMGYYCTPMVTFYEDDMLPCDLKLSNAGASTGRGEGVINCRHVYWSHWRKRRASMYERPNIYPLTHSPQIRNTVKKILLREGGKVVLEELQL
jgi:hypothetical protein